MPVTNWMFDRPAPIDVAAWRLRVTGPVARDGVARELALRYDDVLASPATVLRATLDCTGGWHSAQDWRGVRVG
jgi:DMSO/TMAO reductase YedYZ molybdopterin-dependent catalytic subunit